MERFLELAGENGFSHAAKANLSFFSPTEEVRRMCRENLCGMWGKSWSCPPGCGSIAAARERLSHYHAGILVQTTASLIDAFDLEGMRRAAEEHRCRFFRFVRQVRLLSPDCLPLAAGACKLCRKCTYPERPCRFPAKAMPSMEAYGLSVREICEGAGLQYCYAPQSVTYTSCVLYERV